MIRLVAIVALALVSLCGSAGAVGPFGRGGGVMGSPPPSITNSITMTNVSGSTVTNYPFQFGRPFVDGAVPVGATDCTGTGSVSNGTLTFSTSHTCAVGDVVTWPGATVAAPTIVSGSGTTYALSSALPSATSVTITGSTPRCPNVLLDGSPNTSQFDTKNRYPDGSIEYGVGATVVGSLTNNVARTITFTPGACSNAPTSQASMLSMIGSGDATMNLKSPAQILGTVNNNTSTFTGITNGAFDMTVNGTLYHFTGMNFSAITNTNQVPMIINQEAFALGAPVIVRSTLGGNWQSGAHNVIAQIFTSTIGTGASLSYASTPACSPSTCTDISATLGWTSGTAGTGSSSTISGYSAELTGTSTTVSMKTMLNAAVGGNCSPPGTATGTNLCTLWTSGPVAQTIELADDSTARSFDVGFGDGYHPFRPRFYATFWPSLSLINIRYIGEESLDTENEDLNYGLTLAAGASTPTTIYKKDLSFTGENQLGLNITGFFSGSTVGSGCGSPCNITITGTPSTPFVTNNIYQLLDVNTGYFMVAKCTGSAAFDILVQAGTVSYPITTGDTMVATSAVNHAQYSRWTRSAWIGGTPNAEVNIDNNLAYLESTRFLPNYDTSVTLSPSNIASEYANYAQNANDIYDGDWDQPNGSTTWVVNLAATGARQDIAPYPEWTALWLYSGDWRMRTVALGLADQSSSWWMDMREGQTGKPFLLTDTPGSNTGYGKIASRIGHQSIISNQLYSWGVTGENFLVPVGPVDVITPWGLGEAVAHMPNLVFPQYLLTGDPFYLEQENFVASWTGFDCWGGTPTMGQGCGPYPTTTVYAGAINDQQRGVGWGWRDRAEIAFIEPDGFPEKTYFIAMMDELIARTEGGFQITGTPLDSNPEKTWGAGSSVGNQGTTNAGMFTGQAPALHEWFSTCDPTLPYTSCVDDPQWISSTNGGSFADPWMQWYIHYAIGRAAELGFPMSAINSYTAQFPIGMILDSGMPTLIGFFEDSPLEQGTAGFWTTWAGWISGLNLTSTCCGGSGYTVYYTGNLNADGRPVWLQPGLAMNVDQGQSRAGSAWAWFNTNVHAMVPDFANDPKWDIIPRTDSNTLPAQPIIQ